MADQTPTEASDQPPIGVLDRPRSEVFDPPSTEESDPFSIEGNGLLSMDTSDDPKQLYVDPEGTGSCITQSLPKVMRSESGFYSHFIVEVCPNAIYSQEWKFNNLKRPPFPRGNAVMRNAVAKDAISYYASTNVFYATDDTSRTKYNHYRALFYEKAYNWYREPDKAILLAFPLSDLEEYPNLVIDPTLPIRALYFPQLYYDPNYSNMSRLGQICFFKHEGSFPMQFAHRGSSTTSTVYVNISKKEGLGYIDHCLVVPLKEVMLSLAIPAMFAKRGPEGRHLCYSYIKLWPASAVSDSGHQYARADENDFHMWMDDYITINEGIEYEFKPLESQNKWVKIFTDLISTALRFIPIIGPLAAMSWDITLRAINHPEEFASETGMTADGKNLLKIYAPLFKQMLRSSDLGKIVQHPGRLLA
ncbi:hypothetical protein PT974_05419 [Cladobotryum mycophilum]|uniref:Uncharacterized protein n=1 Tax=Cladobotryum mycophilum TaxID=491253 RepID=A0ABR0SIR0_9HYPO